MINFLNKNYLRLCGCIEQMGFLIFPQKLLSATPDQKMGLVCAEHCRSFVRVRFSWPSKGAQCSVVVWSANAESNLSSGPADETAAVHMRGEQYSPFNGNPPPPFANGGDDLSAGIAIGDTNDLH